MKPPKPTKTAVHTSNEMMIMMRAKRLMSHSHSAAKRPPTRPHAAKTPSTPNTSPVLKVLCD